jgi:hypothetical protein
VAAATLTVGGLAMLGATKVSADPTPSVVATVASASEPTPAVPPTTDAPKPADEPPPSPPPAARTRPTSSDEVQIGDALVIERGQQPADPNTQVGDAVTYER